MKMVRLFGKNVMLRQEKKAVVQLHLPAGAERENQDLFDTIVAGVGDEVTKVKVGDLVVARVPTSCGIINPADGKLAAIIQEDMIQGVIEETLYDGLEECVPLMDEEASEEGFAKGESPASTGGPVTRI